MLHTLGASQYAASGAQFVNITGTVGSSTVAWPTNGVGAGTTTAANSMHVAAKKVVVYGIYVATNASTAIFAAGFTLDGATFYGAGSVTVRWAVQVGQTGWFPFGGPEGILIPGIVGTPANVGVLFSSNTVGVATGFMVTKFLG